MTPDDMDMDGSVIRWKLAVSIYLVYRQNVIELSKRLNGISPSLTGPFYLSNPALCRH
jgi:hypothetical protein